MPRRTLDDLRPSLLDQLAYLIDEVEALKEVMHHVPEPVLVARPPGESLSIKEAYALLALLDETAYLPRARQMATGDEPHFDAVDDATLVAASDGNDQPLDVLLERVQQARRALVSFLRAVPPEAWTHTAHVAGEHYDLYGLAHHIIQHDADLLRTVGYRLHTARLSIVKREA